MAFEVLVLVLRRKLFNWDTAKDWVQENSLNTSPNKTVISCRCIWLEWEQVIVNESLDCACDSLYYHFIFLIIQIFFTYCIPSSALLSLFQKGFLPVAPYSIVWILKIEFQCSTIILSCLSVHVCSHVKCCLSCIQIDINTAIQLNVVLEVWPHCIYFHSLCSMRFAYYDLLILVFAKIKLFHAWDHSKSLTILHPINCNLVINLVINYHYQTNRICIHII